MASMPSQISKKSKKNVSSKKTSIVLNEKKPIHKIKKTAVKNTESVKNRHSRFVESPKNSTKMGLKPKKPKSLQKETLVVEPAPNKAKKLKQHITATGNKNGQPIKPSLYKKLKKTTKEGVPDKKEDSINENEEYMNPKHRAHFHQILSDWKIQLIESTKKNYSSDAK